ncbi:MAG: S9 family peptidase [Xanthomonadales bacterium]|nr:S9 family peptidase [Xanthomonadales bacterium]
MGRHFTAFLLLIPSLALSAGMSLEDISRLSWVTDVAVAPDGAHIAYIQRVPRRPFEDPDGEAWAELRVVSGDRGPRRFVRGDVTVEKLRWSADGKGIFFLATRGPKPPSGEQYNALYAIPVDGGEAFELCSLPDTNIAGYTLHPDGRRVALFATPAKADKQKKLEEHGFNAQVYEEDVRNRQLYLADIGEDSACEPQPIPVDGSVVAADFSPSGDRILLAVAPTSLVDDRYMQTRMRVIDGEGSLLARIDNLGKLGKAMWSPDGRRIAFIGVNDFNDPREGRLKVADARTGAFREVTPNLDGHVVDLEWLNSEQLGAVIHFGVESEYWRVDIETGRRSVLVGQGDRVIRQISRSANGDQVAAIADAANHPREVFAVTPAGLDRLTDSNPWLADRELGRQTTVDYRAADGLDLQGLLIWPVDYEESRSYPLVIFVHGGPESHRSDGWLTTYSQPTQVMAANGYFSFVPNYRGSTGRGVEFSKLDQHGYARPEFDDIVDGKDHLVSLGLVDPKRVGITGGSYGGFATAWSATALSQHYAAGVMFVGISNQISKFGTTDIPNEMHAVHARAWPWEDWQWFLERSPIYHVESARTPLLIMHGDSDPRVHPSQSLEMYRYLKSVDQAPVRLVLYPGEKHGNRKAAAQYDYSRRMVRWMDHYLTGPGGEPPPHEIDYEGQLPEDSEE